MVNSRFKFRAWEKTSKEMVYDVQNVSRKRIIGESACESFHDVLSSWEYVVMQFTGLYDKNGKEIYEGDIVRFHYKTGVYKIGTVVWNDLFGSWDIDCSDFVSYKSLGQYKSVSEIIGNIYEHKHLLEGTE